MQAQQQVPDLPAHSITVAASIKALRQASHDMVHDYPGKAEVLAPVVGKSNPSSLSNEVNLRASEHGSAKLGLIDSALLQLHTQDFRLMHSYNAMLGYSSVYLGDFAGICDVELMTFYAKWHKEVGDVAREVSRTLEDGRITHAEVARVRKEGMEQVQAFLGFLQRLEGLACD